VSEQDTRRDERVRIIGEHAARCRCAVLRVAVALSPDGGQTHGVLVFDPVNMPTDEVLNYGTFSLHSHAFSALDAVEHLVRVVQGQVPLVTGARPRIHEAAHSNEVDQAIGSVTGWPETIDSFKTSGSSYDMRGEAGLRFGMKPQPSEYEAVMRFVWGDPLLRHARIRDASLQVIVPRRRARIFAVDWVGGTISAEVEVADETECELQAIAHTDDDWTALESKSVGAPASWKVPDTTASVALYVVHRDGTMLATHTQTPDGPRLRRETDDSGKRARIKADLGAGEGRSIEFKPFIQAGHEKEDEVVKTMIAFANAGGGRLYVGVDDYGGLQGVEHMLKAGKGAFDAARSSVIKRLLKLKQDEVVPPAPLTIEFDEIDGAPIIIVQIQDGSEKPYATKKQEIFVRRGATNKRADPQTDLRPMLSGSRLGGSR
jgi:hypothetical protein